MEVEEDNVCQMTEKSDSNDRCSKNADSTMSYSESMTCDVNDGDITNVPGNYKSAKSECDKTNSSKRLDNNDNGHAKDLNTKTIDNDETKEPVKDVSFMESIEPTTSQNNSPTSSNDNESNASPSDQTTSKRSITKNQVNGDSGISMEKSCNSSDEDSSKRQKLNEETKTADTENSGNTPSRFHKLKSKVKKRNYRNKKRLTGDSGDGSSRAPDESSSPGRQDNDVASSPNVQSDTTENASARERNRFSPEMFSDSSDDIHLDDSNGWTTASEDELDEQEHETPSCLKKEKPKPNWLITTEIIKRELGNNPLFRRRFYGSLHAVERLELMYKLNEHEGCVNALNFNQKGNLLASGSDDLDVVIWDWAIGKKRQTYDSGHRSNVFQVRWLPFDVEYLMVTCGRDGQVRLLDLEHGTTRKLASHHGSIHKLAIHPDSPHVVISCGEDAKILSIDIRENKPTKLLMVKDDSAEVQLYTIHSNPHNSNEFCVGGRSQIVRIYDRRKLSSAVHKLCPDHLSNNSHAHVTCAVYNYNGTEVLVSYNDEDIYLFDTSGSQINDFAHKYQGHRNSATVKGVNYFGPKSEYIVSGSDCGNIFIWDKNTEAIVQWMAGDEQGVVNNLEPHPHIPILATSGLDYDVKIWVPSCEQPPIMKELESCVKINAINRTRTANVPQAFDGQMLWVLLRHMHHTERARNRNTARGGDYHQGDEDINDSSNDFDSSEHSDSNSEMDSVDRLQCRPS